jgi:hypothetical protein
MASIGYSGPGGKLICERNKKLKISCQTPFKVETSGDLIFLPGIVVFACDFLILFSRYCSAALICRNSK